MNKQILSFFAGVCMVILTAAATGVTEFKPAPPKSIVVITGSVSSCKDSVIQYHKLGFHVKSQSSSIDGNYRIQLFIVMEKY